MPKTGRRARTGDSGLRLELKGQVTLTRLGEAVEAWTGFLQEVGKNVAGVAGRDAVRYVITEARGGSLTLDVSPQPARKHVRASAMPRIAAAVTSGIRTLERTTRRPKHFTDNALRSLRDLARLAGPETPAVNVSNGTGTAVSLSARLITHVEAMLSPDIQTIGTVEGKLEGLIIHGKRRFLVYDSITERQVSCYFTPRVEWESVLRAFGKRVAVSGFIRSRSSGERVSITVNRFYVFPDEDTLPTLETSLGSARVS